jgi:hypothetical protein
MSLACVFLQHSCNNTNKLAKHPGNEIRAGSTDVKSYMYNSDSSYIVHIINPYDDHHIVPLIFAVTEAQSNDTILFSNKEYNRVDWKNDSILVFTKILGISYSNAKSRLNAYPSLIEKYFNCKSGNFLPVRTNKIKTQNEK